MPSKLPTAFASIAAIAPPSSDLPAKGGEPVCYSRVVKPAPFAYHRPATVPEAVVLLAELAPQNGRVLAGGQSLVPIMAFRLARPEHLIDINRVAGLDRLETEGR